MPGKTTLVNNTAALLKAAKAAKGGDTILLAPGEYGAVSFASVNPTGGGVVTIKSAVAASAAVVTYLAFTNSSNFVVQNIDVHHVLGPKEAEWAVGAAIRGSKNISLVGIDFTGSLDGNRNNDGNGLTIGNSSRISVLDSTFREFNNAMTIGTSDHVIVAGNRIQEVREGVNMSGVTSGLFERNYLSDIKIDPSKGDHSDGFQVHTGSGASSDLVFRSNVILTGAGSSQGIFIRAEKAGLVHHDITIENNYIEANMRNAIDVGQTDGFRVTGNTIRDGGNPGLIPALVINQATHGLVENNIAPSVLIQNAAQNVGTVIRNNVDIWDARTNVGIASDKLFTNPVGQGLIDFSTLSVRAGSVADTGHAGFRGVTGIGHLSGTADTMLAAYVPKFDALFGANLHG